MDVFSWRDKGGLSVGHLHIFLLSCITANDSRQRHIKLSATLAPITTMTAAATKRNYPN